VKATRNNENEMTRASEIGMTQVPNFRKPRRTTRNRSERVLSDHEFSYVNQWFRDNAKSFHKIDKIENHGEMRADVMEKWVNSVLEVAQHLNIPGVILSKRHTEILEAYGFDRKTLSLVGVNKENADRLYRAMFVYSQGFYQLIKSIVKDASNDFVLMSSIWKVYLILLEYCNKVDYRALITKLNSKHEQEINNIETRYNTQIEIVSKKLELHNSDIKFLETKMKKLNSENEELKSELEKVRTHLNEKHK